MQWRSCLGVIFCALLLGCSHLENANAPPSDKQLDQIATQYIRDHFPDWGDEHDLQRVIFDRGDHWEWTFELPTNTAGGVPVVLIEKKNRQVIRAYHTQ